MKKVIYIISLLLLTSGVAFSQKTADDFLEKGMEKYKAKDYKMALEFFTAAIDIDAQHYNSYLQRGFTHTLLKEYEKAIADFSEVIRIHDQHTWAYISRGSAKNKLKRYNEAMVDFNKALELAPEGPEAQEALNNRGFSYKFLDDHKQACRDWKKSQKMGNDEAKIIYKNNFCK